jgi:hypothetical protein
VPESDLANSTISWRYISVKQNILASIYLEPDGNEKVNLGSAYFESN